LQQAAFFSSLAAVSILEIKKFPDPVLKKHAKAVTQIDGRIAGMLNNMVDTMYTANGIGLAAPQVGLLERAIVVDTDIENRGQKLVKIINPEVTEASGEITIEEGCLSVVNFTAEIARPRKILVKGWTVDQQEVELEFEDIDAVCIQHEIDHLEGILLVDHISRLKRDMYRKRLKKQDSDSKQGGGGAPKI
jgi:peptide deformylase